MSLLKVSLCINRPKQRLLCMDTRRGCRSKRSPTPWKNKNFFFAVWGAFLLLFFTGRLCYFFITWGAFLLRLPPDVGPFSQCRGLFCYYFLHVGGLFLSSWGILCLHRFFYGLAPSPYNLFCGRMLLCNFHPIFSAITYSGHYVPNKAHCNTRVQFTTTRK